MLNLVIYLAFPYGISTYQALIDLLFTTNLRNPIGLVFQSGDEDGHLKFGDSRAGALYVSVVSSKHTYLKPMDRKIFGFVLTDFFLIR